MTIACVGLFASPAARASEAEKTIAVGGNLSASYNAMRAEGSPRSNGSSISATPTLDVLVAGGLSLGVSAQFSRASSGSEGVANELRSTYFQPGVQLGYLVPIGEHAAFWPVARAGYGLSWNHHESTTATSDTTSRTVELSLLPQVLLRPTKTFFVRFTPGMLAYRVTTVDGRGGGILGMSPMFAIGVGVML